MFYMFLNLIEVIFIFQFFFFFSFPRNSKHLQTQEPGEPGGE